MLRLEILGKILWFIFLMAVSCYVGGCTNLRENFRNDGLNAYGAPVYRGLPSWHPNYKEK